MCIVFVYCLELLSLSFLTVAMISLIRKYAMTGKDNKKIMKNKLFEVNPPIHVSSSIVC